MLVPLLLVLGFGATAAPETVVGHADAFTQKGKDSVVSGQRYQYSLAELPATFVSNSDSSRSLWFANDVRIIWYGAKNGATYRVKASFLSDSDQRRMEFWSGKTLVESEFALPFGKALNRTWTLPPTTYLDGSIDLTFRRIAGPNAVISSIDILSDDPTLLKSPAPLAETLRDFKFAPPSLTERPNLVAGVAKPILSLNGQWQFSYAGSKPNPIAVPAEWVMQGFDVPKDTWALYTRRFELPSDWSGKSIKLRFDSVQSQCKVRVNGKPVGEHEGGFVPFELDVTDACVPGSNTLEVDVKSDSVADVLASASQYAAHPLGGITRKVTLFAVPKVAMADLWTSTKNVHTDSNLTVRYSLSSPSTVSLKLRDARGSVVASSLTNSGEAELLVKNAKRWDPEHPYLYTLEASVLSEGTVVEAVKKRVGLKEIKIEGNRVLVNGSAIKLKGVCRHEVHPLTGRSITPELCSKDAELFRAANCNYIRTSHYPPSEEFLEAADELGLFVECEAPLCWVQHGANPTWASWNYREEGLFPYLLRANAENVVANRSHVSILIWSLGNESAWSELWAEVLRRVKTLDPSRPTSFHDQCWGGFNNEHSKADIAVYHYPGWNEPATCDKDDRPVLFGEYAHLECYNRQEVYTDPGIRDKWGPPFAKFVDLMFEHPGCLGGAIWSGIDDTFHLPNGKLIGYGPWGPIDGWRRPKPEYWHVLKAYSPVRVDGKIAPGQRIKLTNRYDFTNLSEVAVRWSFGNQKGTIKCSAAPHQTASLTLPAPKAVGGRMRLEFVDPRGFVCNVEEQDAPVATIPMGSNTPVNQREDSGAIVVTNGPTQYAFSKADGSLKASVDGKLVIDGLPTLMVIPLTNGRGGNDYENRVEPLNPVMKGWKVTSIKKYIAEGTVTVDVNGTYDGAAGLVKYIIMPSGYMVVQYSFALDQPVNPRQWGLVFYAPKAFQTLEWSRKGLWTAYPKDHIGRLTGTAHANPIARKDVEAIREPQKKAWSLDSSPMGSNDFRSTKSEVIWAQLSDDTNKLRVEGGKDMSVRAFVDGARVALLVAGFNTGGADSFFAFHYDSERRPINVGTNVVGTFTVRIGK